MLVKIAFEVSRLECRFANPGKERNDYETPSLKVETVVEKGEIENERMTEEITERVKTIKNGIVLGGERG